MLKVLFIFFITILGINHIISLTCLTGNCTGNQCTTIKFLPMPCDNGQDVCYSTDVDASHGTQNETQTLYRNKTCATRSELTLFAGLGDGTLDLINYPDSDTDSLSRINGVHGVCSTNSCIPASPTGSDLKCYSKRCYGNRASIMCPLYSTSSVVNCGIDSDVCVFEITWRGENDTLSKFGCSILSGLQADFPGISYHESMNSVNPGAAASTCRAAETPCVPADVVFFRGILDPRLQLTSSATLLAFSFILISMSFLLCTL